MNEFFVGHFNFVLMLYTKQQKVPRYLSALSPIIQRRINYYTERIRSINQGCQITVSFEKKYEDWKIISNYSKALATSYVVY
jgi:hypothetical protein